MKKALLGIAGILIMAFVFVLFVNAGKEDPAKKAETEMTSPCMMKCEQPATAAATACDAACKEKCDPAKCENCDDPDCKGDCKKAVAETKACCPMHAK